MSDEKEPEEAKGYIHTHWDCPHCDFDNVSEGHIADEEVQCEECGETVKVTT
jgi:transcription elongation factor Elf1